jgi:hypothetical protein
MLGDAQRRRDDLDDDLVKRSLPTARTPTMPYAWVVAGLARYVRGGGSRASGVAVLHLVP